jgi:glucose/arabinose dehydrogenase
MPRLKKKPIIIGSVLVLTIIIVGILIFRDELTKIALKPTDSAVPVGVTDASESDIEIAASNLQTPWGIAFLPNGDILVTERPGSLKRITGDAQSYTIDGVIETSEGGLLGIALHPDFARNNLLYLYSTYRNNGTLLNRVERYTYSEDQLSLDRVVIEDIPGSSTHDGGMIAFGPDKKLYITTGDASRPDSAQDTAALSGKILRINDDGSIPADNPFNNAVYSYGHRNPQGITWDDDGIMWSSEHGPSGSATGRDELNRIDKGANYGWPVISGDETREDMRSPVVQSGDNDTWAPGAIAYHDGSLFFTGLRGQTLYQAEIIDKNTVTLSRHFGEKYGRLRAAVTHNNQLYISSSNTDGRGFPKDNDDKIIKINPRIFSR